MPVANLQKGDDWARNTRLRKPKPTAWNSAPVVPNGAASVRLDRNAKPLSPHVAWREGVLKEKGTLRVLVDGDRCQGHNRCHALAPELFEIDELGFARAKGTGVVPPDLEAKALLAVRNCPEYAVRAVRDDT